MRARGLLAALALLCAVGSALTFLVALHTAHGLHDDAALYRRVSGNGTAVFDHAGRTALETIDTTTLGLGVLALAFLALARGRAGRALAAAAVVACSVGSAELLKHGLPHIARAVPPGRLATFPSGHTSIAVSLGLGLLLAAPPVLRPAAALLGAAYAAGIGLAVIVLGWHYPSDVVGSFFLCGTWAALAGIALRAVPGRTAVSPRGLVVGLAVVAVALAAAAALAARHPLAVQSVRSSPALAATAAALGVLSLAVFGALAPLVGESR
jgi:membrane-associated phospholipid phosphatase